MQYRLTKIFSTHDRVRTNVVEGELKFTPTVGFPLQMIAPPLDKQADARFICTTPIKKIEEKDGKQMIHTANSLYSLETIAK